MENRKPVARGFVASFLSVRRDPVPGATRQPFEPRLPSLSSLDLRRSSARSTGLQDQPEVDTTNQRRRVDFYNLTSQSRIATLYRSISN